jgi:tetratricopeptide (TPR) repeat protein
MIQRYLLQGFCVLLAVCSVRPAAAKQVETLVRLGDSAYARKSYDSAVYYYSRASATAKPDAIALYKLGNAHFRLNHTGEAALAYERALKRRPGFADAAENLDIIQRAIQPHAGRNEVFFIRWWHALTKPSLSNVWAILGIICFCFPLGVLIWSRFMRRWPAWLWPQAIVGGMALSLILAILSAAAVPGTPDTPAVVMRDDAAFQPEIKPADKQAALKVPEGLVISVLDDEGEQIHVALPDGRKGFMQAADIALVE